MWRVITLGRISPICSGSNIKPSIYGGFFLHTLHRQKGTKTGKKRITSSLFHRVIHTHMFLILWNILRAISVKF